MKLLIVDDSAMVRRAVTASYQNTVFSEIETASDGILALTIFKQFRPDVVTLDITMPHMDGLAALVQMLKLKPKTQILVISALADQHTAVEALKRGANQFICKPFTGTELKEALDDLLEEIDSEDEEEAFSFEEEKDDISFSFGPGTNAESESNGFGLDDEDGDDYEDDEDDESDTPSLHYYPSGFVPTPKISISIDDTSN
jgi:two-component system, chemotaxis family, chemotaxis protein CheY